MTFQSNINTQVTNSSPVFNHEFAAFTYIGDNFSFDASATDPDGDQLVYSLDNPFDGASLTSPITNPPFAPPYIPVP
ncbi:MAG: hypothetical protein M3Q95_13100 [Bacteroidota bacterium]|nr:hypothetical protein [Bacteroidota bacterium]